jgi:hypothetical protein
MGCLDLVVILCERLSKDMTLLASILAEKMTFLAKLTNLMNLALNTGRK